MSSMKLTAVCVTWNRPALLGRLIHCFEQQTYDNCELLILDDAGQYPDQPHGDRWKVISFRQRFLSLGAKRNAVTALVSEDTDAIAVWDDDDLYYPWAIAACAKALGDSNWVQPREVYEWRGKQLIRVRTYIRRDPHRYGYHSGWAYRISAFNAIGGYPLTGQEDFRFATAMINKYGPSADPQCEEFPEPYLIYTRGHWTEHLSGMYLVFSKQGKTDPFDKTWQTFGSLQPEPAQIRVESNIDYMALERPAVVMPRLW